MKMKRTTCTNDEDDDAAAVRYVFSVLLHTVLTPSTTATDRYICERNERSVVIYLGTTEQDQLPL